MKRYIFSLLFSLTLNALPLAYDPAELRFETADSNNFACLMHRQMCIVSVPYELASTLNNIHQVALRRNNNLVIKRMRIPNILNDLTELEESVFLSREAFQRRRFFFDFSQISFSRKVGNKGGTVRLKLKGYTEEFAFSPERFEKIVTQIKYIKKHKKTVKIDTQILRDTRDHGEAHELFKIDNRIP